MKTTPEPNPEDIGPEKEGLSERAQRLLLELAIKESLATKLEVFGDEDDVFVTRLKSLKDALDVPDDANVVYSGSSTHVGVARVFGKERVVHVDPDEEACGALRSAGYIAEELQIEDYHPKEKVDLLVGLNSYGTPDEEVIKNTVKSGGWIIVNNYTHWASELSRLEGVSLKAALLPSYMDVYPELKEGLDIPSDATDLREFTYRIGKEGGLNSQDPDAFEFTEEKPLYEDGLFIFQVAWL